LRARSLKGWQLKDLSNAMGGTSGISFLSDIEKGKRSISPPTVGKLIKALELDEGWIDRFLGSDTTVEAEITPADRIADATLEHTEVSGDAERLRQAGVTERALIGLAQRVAAETSDITQAWAELQNAMEMAVRVQADGRVSSNHGDFVDEVLKRVAELSADGEYRSAGDAIDAALSREEEEWQARKGKLLDRGGEVALLDRDTERAADERGAAFDDLGTALKTLGERESGMARLEAAVKAHEAALEEWNRETLPLNWATTQNNLGNALQALGARESGTARLEALNWAMTQNNLGTALKTLGARESDTTRLEEAVKAYEAALEEWDRESVPLNWATTQNNLGTALQTLGARESGTARLKAAVKAYEAALEERTRERVPLDWAGTQNNLGNALRILGARESGTARLEEAVKGPESGCR